VLDCDPGHDDALAILLAAADPRLELLAITTVAGNQTLEKTTLNARLICSLAGINGVPIAAGCDKPIASGTQNSHLSFDVAHSVHGQSGLDGITISSPTVPLSKGHAIDLLRQVILEHPSPITVIATGPLTNIARLIEEHPEVISRIGEIVFMGGSTERGNVTPYGEFNVVADPEAASQVLASGVAMTFCGLNVTHQVLVSPEVTDKIRSIDTPLSHTCVNLLDFFAQTYYEIFGMRQPPLHDPVAVARVIDPRIVGCVRVPVAIELSGPYTRGATVVDLHNVTGRPVNAHVATRIDTETFWNLMIDAIRYLSFPRSD
jgi:purine nucleosidase/pyrimidine-specific ribonucleoside hydrolase